MKLWMRVVVLFTVVMSIAVGAQAQMWGAGLYGGMQACPYPYAAAPGASSDLDEVREAEEAINEAKRNLRAKKSELKSVERKRDRYRNDIERTVSSDYTEALFNHMDNGYNCSEYSDYMPTERSPQSEPGPEEDGEDDVAAAGTVGGNQVRAGGNQTHDGIDAATWGRVCLNKGDLRKDVTCNQLRGAGGEDRRGSRGSPGTCAKAITEYRRETYKAQKLQDQIENLEAAIEDAKEDKRLAQQEARDEAEERRREAIEGGVCLECLTQSNSYRYERPATDWSSVIGNVGLGLVSMYAGYKTNKMVSNANANIGWPTDPWAAQGYGYGIGAIGMGLGQAIGGGSGIYGAMGGGIGQGAFGCAGNNGGPFGMMGPYGGMNGGGMWGNPYGMAGLGIPGMGGGMYMPGMGPWGMAGPFGGMGNGMGMGMGIGMGMPMGMAGGMGMPMGMAGGMGMPMGMAGMGYPGMGMAGGMGMPMGMAGMGYPGMGMAGGMGMPMGMAGMGMPMGGAMGLGGMQMQQQMMQMQMQQYQMYMQQQQQYVQQQMQRQQVVASLQQELYGLLYRIQQVQYGGGYMGGSIGTGGYIGGGIGIGIGIGSVSGSGLSTIPGTGSVGSGSGLPAPR